MVTAQRLTLLRLFEGRAPWRIGEPGEFPDREQRAALVDLGLAGELFPAEVAVDRWRGFMMLNVRGYQVLGYALEWRDRLRIPIYAAMVWPHGGGLEW